MKSKFQSQIFGVILIIILLSLFSTIGIFSNINSQITDKFYGHEETLESIVVVGIDDYSLQNIGRWPWNREIFVEFVDKLNKSKVVAIDIAFFESSAYEDDKILEEELLLRENIVLASEYRKFEVENSQVFGREPLIPVGNLKNMPHGYVNIPVDKDGVGRSSNLGVQGEIEDSFSEVIYKKVTGIKFQNEQNRFLVDFAYPNSYKTYSFYDVISDENIAQKLENKIVIVGITSPDFHDTLFVPSSNGVQMAGVEFHANVLESMLTNSNLKEQGTISIIITVLFLALLMFLIYKITPLWLSTVIVFVAGIVIIALGIFFYYRGFLINVVYPQLSFFLTYLFLVAHSYITEKKSKQEIRDAFGKYVSPVVIEELIKNPDKLKLGGEKRKITILFSDIAGFTTISETLGPEKLVELLNDYLTDMTEIVLKRNGLVDKFIGDAIMAFWGAPLLQENQETLASRTAKEMIALLDKKRSYWKEKYGVDVYIRVGIATGDVIVGNMGSHQRFDYTVMGDTVNLAARLEGINKTYGTTIMLNQGALAGIDKRTKTRLVDMVRVKGKNDPSKIFELIVDDYDEKGLNVYELALKQYIKGDFKRAKKNFEKSYSILNDGPSKLFIYRCEVLISEGIDKKKWDGVFTMKTK